MNKSLIKKNTTIPNEPEPKNWEIVGEVDGNTKMTRKELNEFKSVVSGHAAKQSEEQIKSNQVIGISAKMDLYTMQPIKNGEVLELGFFIKEILKVYGLTQNKLAAYLGIDKTNLSALMNGKRNINGDLAIKLERIFGIRAELWLMVQDKNELWRIQNINREKYEQYSLKGLMAA